MTIDAMAIMSQLVLEDGRRWGEVATDWQHADAVAMLDLDGPRMHFQTRPRGGSKTTDEAGLLLAVLLEQAPPSSRLYWVAVDAEQAALGHEAAAGFVERTPGLRDELRVMSTQVVNRRNGAAVEVLPADGASAWGLRPYVVCVDELAAWPATSNHRRLWSAVVSSMPKVAGSRLVCLTSAGDPAHWSHRVLVSAQQSERWRVSEMPGPLPWRTAEDLDEQRRLLTESEFARLHENRWTAPEDRLTTVDAVLLCVGHEDSPLPAVKGVRYVLSLDVGLVNDATVVTVGHRRPNDDGSVTVVVDRQDVFQGSKAKPVDLTVVEQHIATTVAVYNGADAVIDPWQAAQIGQGLRRRGVKVREFAFSQSSTGRLGLLLYRLLRDGLLDLPRNELLIDELSNVRLRETAPGSYRLDHDQGKHDDRAVSIALLAYQLLEEAPRRRRSIVSIGVSDPLPRLGAFGQVID